MNETPVVPQPRKRVRTGCRTCRRRRRKCDEGKPSCENCKSKNLVCQYGPKFTFVQSKKQPFEAEPVAPEPSSPRDRTAANARAATPDASLRHVSQVVEYGDRSNVQDDITTEQPLDSDGPAVAQDEPVRDDEPIFHGESFPQALGPDFRSVRFDDRQMSGTDVIGQKQQDEPHGQSTQDVIHGWDSTATEYRPHAASQVVVSNNTAEPGVRGQPSEAIILDEQTELELICHYRYKIAPLLDLGVGTIYYGIQVLLNLRVSSAIYNAVVALAHRHKTAMTAPGTLSSSSPVVTNDLEAPADSEDVAARILLIWRDALSYAPSQWCEILLHSNCSSFSHTLSSNHQLLLSRLILAARLLSPAGSGYNETHGLFYHDSLQPPIAQDLALPQAQLLHALILLEHSLSFLPGSGRTRVLMDIPLLTAWQSCWQESQMWFASRCEELEEILGLPNSNLSQTEGEDNPGFPIIVFSNGCAMVANVVHHLTSMLLLQHKPRLVKSNAAHVSSASPTWHMQRIIGIAAASGVTEVWDPIVIAALVHAARRLSHRKQLSVVAETLQRFMKVSGMQLQGEIDKILQTSEYG